jgi:hypothetical protein
LSDQVSAVVIAHSKSAVTGHEMVTFEWEFPRIILAEVNTHNALSKNASSSRAIPVATINTQVRSAPAMPVRFGKANTGMQDAGEHNEAVFLNFPDNGYCGYFTPQDAWAVGCEVVASISDAFTEAGYAKQVANRWTEVGQRMKQVVSATDLANFFWLRDHHMADPTIDALAKAAKEALAASTPVILNPGEWHVPYYNDGYWIKSNFLSVNRDVAIDKFGYTLQQALDISASCTAQVSYRKLDDTMEKARSVVARLNLHGEQPDDPVHASPLEHQATPIARSECNDPSDDTDGINLMDPCTWEPGITHRMRDGTLASGNLKGFIQHRQLVPNHVKEG